MTQLISDSHSATEQVKLLRKATNRQIIRKIHDDTVTLRSTRASQISRTSSTVPSSRPSVQDQMFDFEPTLAASMVYRRPKQPQHVRAISTPESHSTTGGHSPFTDQGYDSSRTGTLEMNSPSASWEKVSAQQQGYATLPSTPSGLVHPWQQTRSASFKQASARPTPNSMRRSESDSKASRGTMRSLGSRNNGRLSSLIERVNPRSRQNLFSLSTRSSANLSMNPTLSRRRRPREPNFNTSIDLTAADSASIPPIIKAAQAGSRDEVERLIDRGCDIEARHWQSRRNALLVASHCGKEEIVDLLVQHNARLDVTDGSNWTALHLAASRGHCGVLEVILADSDILEATNIKNQTGLWVAADRGQLNALQMLINWGAEINARAENHMTALHAAAKRGDDEVVQILLSHGADMEAMDGSMMTALHYTCLGGHLEAMEIVLHHRANMEAPGRNRKTPLICAAEAGRLRAVERLLQKKASLDSIDDTGMTALHWAAYNGHEQIIRLLSDRRKSLGTVNSMGRTALHLAVMQSQFAVVELLLRRGVTPGQQCRTGLTALHYACLADNPEIANLLLVTGSNIEAEDQFQQRPIHLAAARGSVRLLDLLCDKGASLDARDGVGDRPLGVACRYGQVAAVQRLLDRGSPLCVKVGTSFREDSPLSLAAMGGHLHVVSLLLDRGASTIRKDKDGWQPFRYAAYHGHPEVLRLLLSCSHIPDLDIPDLLLMPEAIGFSAQSEITDERKRQVDQLLRQALENPDALKNAVPSYLRGGDQRGSYERKFPPPAQMSRGIPHSGDPQELPGNLEQGLPSSRSATPDGMRRYAQEFTLPPGTGVRDLRQPDQPDLPAHLVALLRESQDRSSLPQLEQQIAEEPQQHEYNIPGTSATFIPRPIPVRWPSPSTQAPSDGYRAGISIPIVPSPVSVLEQQGDAAYIPRTIPSTQELILPRSQSGSVPSKKASHDKDPDSGSDSESISSVYTASEGRAEPDTDVNVGTGSHGVREGVHELAIPTL
ncbi:hypothetical protein N7474_002610 [Penicillium riverlandense]|uniref:uncharacterized protein n=1 Tax=Penicillium riverlandense TaxID=1903569 RepID=UPI002548F755|nr:uncharacterized protein N7474_002610 [Penicillium riverlandense]KAJ5825472.1 hypothetical protein N7474_002610 [Penicillium riverlandense]